MSIITIDGTIGAGKSTIMNFIHINYRVPIDLEPIDTWQPYLTELYNSKCSNNALFKFQSRVWLDRCWIQEKIANTALLMERSPYFQENVFIKYHYDVKHLEKKEYDILSDMYRRTAHLWSPRGYIYLRSNPINSYERVNKRSRMSECSGISLGYMQSLHKYHENAYMNAVISGLPVICIDVENKTVPQISHEVWNAMSIFGL